MELAKVSPNGQITIPLSIRKRLKLQPGDDIIFFENDGKIFITNPGSTEKALLEMHSILQGSVADAGISSEEDVQRLVDEIRYGGSVDDIEIMSPREFWEFCQR